MRTTLVIDDDILAYARAKAARDQSSIGEVISAMARKGIGHRDTGAVWNGIPQLPVRDKRVVITPEFVNELRDELP